MRFKIYTAIDKENTNDNFLITIHAGDRQYEMTPSLVKRGFTCHT